MTPPPTILYSQIVVKDRIRSDYPRIPELAQSIVDNGLIQPPVLVPLGPGDSGEECFGLDAGGRRCKALEYLLGTGEWDGVLYHGVTSEYEPLRVGYILKGERFCTPFQRAMTEIAENLDRVDPDWRDTVKAVVKAYRLCKTEAHANGEEILMRDFGALIGVEYTKLNAAIIIHDELIINPDFFKDCTSIRGAKSKLMKHQAIELTKILAKRSMAASPTLRPPAPVSEQPAPKPEESHIVHIPLTSSFINCNSLEYMATIKTPAFDHIVTDPDYAVSKERLGASVLGAEDGVHQDTIELSLQDLFTFLELSWVVLKPQGFCVFWYDLDHHEKLQETATKIGFMVQRWPLTWVKSDYRSNSAPAFNFCKNVEYAMVCRKPNAVLARAQMSSVFSCASIDTVKRFGHPFAKPVDVSKWIYSAISIKGQTVYDPFGGSFALSVAALEFGLKPVGSEISVEHYSNGLMNMQTAYKKILEGSVTFS